MTTFRIHTSSGGKHDITAETADQARKIAMGRKVGVITKIKRVKEKA